MTDSRTESVNGERSYYPDIVYCDRWGNWWRVEDIDTELDKDYELVEYVRRSKAILIEPLELHDLSDQLGDDDRDSIWAYSAGVLLGTIFNISIDAALGIPIVPFVVGVLMGIVVPYAIYPSLRNLEVI